VNGQLNSITSSPQFVNLTGLPSDGNPVDVSVIFTDLPGCSQTFTNAFTAPISCACAEDFNNDNDINVADLLILLADIGCFSTSCAADLDNNNTVNGADLSIFLVAYGTTCN
jgi:hypothetical protein